MSPLALVVHDNEFKDHPPRLLPGGKPHPMDEFKLEREKEAFCDGVVPTIALPAHASNELIANQYRLKIIAGILTATIRMNEQPPCLDGDSRSRV